MAAKSDHRELARDRGRERALFDAALIELRAEEGFAEVTAAALCRGANLDSSAFGRRYVDLEGCFCQMLESERDRLFTYLDRALVGRPRWVDRPRAVAYALLRYPRAEPDRTRVLTVELYRGGERATRIWSETISRRLSDLIAEGRQIVPEMCAAVLSYPGAAAAAAELEVPPPTDFPLPPPVLRLGVSPPSHSGDAP